MDRIKKLSEVKKNEFVAVSCIDGLKEEMHKRLIEMGFVKGTKIQVIKNDKRRHIVLVCVRGYLLSIDYNIADYVFVWGD